MSINYFQLHKNRRIVVKLYMINLLSYVPINSYKTAVLHLLKWCTYAA